MSSRPISRSPDLRQLRAEGIDLAVIGGFLVVRDVPYVNSQREVKRGIVVCKLNLADDVTQKSSKHTVFFAGEHPCDQHGQPLAGLVNDSSERKLDEHLTVQYSFSCKQWRDGKVVPYENYYEQVTIYLAIITSPARAIDANATPNTFPFIESDDDDSPFRYEDTATSRSQIGLQTAKLSASNVAIVGLGGTGSYVLDLVAKTRVKQLHLIDGDKFLQHNAFRSPGATPGRVLRRKPTKVEYLWHVYRHMRTGIVPHNLYLDESNVDLLDSMDFVFLCVDKGAARSIVSARLVEKKIPFIDVGMGIVETAEALTGILRITTVTPKKGAHTTRLPLTDQPGANPYSTNIQIADCNALCAALAVIRWKKLCGFYLDLENEHHALYTIDGNSLNNEEQG